MRKRLLALGLGYALVLVLLFVTADNPGRSIGRLFIAPFLTGYSIGNLLNTMGLLLLTAGGIVLTFQSGAFNLGGEGQVYTGALLAALVGLRVEALFPGIGIVLYLIAGGLGGFLLGLLSGLLKRFTRTSILISSYLLSGAGIAIINFLIAGPLRQKESYLLSTEPLASTVHIPRLIPGTNSHVGLILMLLAPVLLWFFLYRSTTGYKLRLKGTNRTFARYGGIRTASYDLWPIGVSGFLHGLAGAMLVGGNHFAALQGGSAGLGWNGIAVALIAGNRPQFLIPAAFFLSYLLQGIDGATLFSRIPVETGYLIQGLIFIVITMRKSE